MVYEIDKKTSERINILKALLMVLVVFIHSYREQITFIEGNVVLKAPQWLETTKYVISQIIARSAVPAFFMISAVLLYRKEFTWKHNMFKKANTILVPYIFLNSFWILFFFFAQKSRFAAAYFVTPQSHVAQWGITGWLDAYLGNFIDPYPLLYPTWFLRDLFVLNIFAVVIKKCVDAFPRLVLLAVGCMWLFPIPVPIIGGGKLSGQSFVFFILGYYVVKYNIRMESLEKWSTWFISTLYAILVMLTFISRSMSFGYTIRNLTLAVGIVWIVKISQVVSDGLMKEQLLAFARHSFFVYAFHEMGLTILTKIVTRWVNMTWQIQVFEYFGLPVLIIGICVLTSSIMRTVMPGFYGILTGYRNKGFSEHKS